jgi:carbonic anhydrase
MADVTRRDVMRALGVSAGVAAATVAVPAWLEFDDALAETPSAAEATMTPDQALARLVAGNRRFANDKVRSPRRGTVRRAEIAQGQNPFATVVSCADSRVTLELIFDQGLGDLFVIRVAGNTVADPIVIGSVEYAAVVLNTPLIMVLGHEECGAVKAAIDTATNGTVYPGDLPAVITPILPAVQQTLSVPKATQLEAAAEANAQNQTRLLAAVPLLADRVTSGALKIVGAIYELRTGKVDLLS